MELGITPSRVRQMILEKKLKAKKAGRDHLISDKALAGAKKRKRTPGPERTKRIRHEQS
jgi:hypothetical protein